MVHRNGGRTGGLRALPALLAAAGLVLAAPVAGAAAVRSLLPTAPVLDGYVPFTPARIDPALARRVAATLGFDGLRFTPAPRASRGERVVTMAVRVDQATARAITVRRVLAEAAPGKLAGTLGAIPLVEPTRYNLGTARGFQSFAAPAPKGLALPEGIRDIAMADLATYRADAGSKSGKPARFQPRVAFVDGVDAGRAPRTLEGSGEQTVDVGGAYRVTRNLAVTAGVRVSQDRNRIAPLTDGVEDDKAVYVGTQFRF